MKYYIITLKDNQMSCDAADRCKASVDLPIETFDAITPNQVEKLMDDYGIKWTYPWNELKHDFASGLQLSPYKTKSKQARIACFLSHYTLWKECKESNEPMLILEHDAIFVKKPPIEKLLDSNFSIIGLNNPLGATRRAKMFYDQVKAGSEFIQSAPKIDDMSVPQGIAGNSAYIIKPNGARKLINLVKEFGAWPNDAIMCKQLVGPGLGVTKTFFTEVQRTISTTSE